MQTKSDSISVKYRLIFGVLLGLICCQSSLLAQISAPKASYSSITEYTSGTQNEIFVFCDEGNSGVGELKAVSPDGTTGWDFTWTKWDSGTNTYGAPIKTNNGDESILDGRDNGLYRVTVEKGADIRNYQAWAINHLKNANQPTFIKTNMDCVGVHFTASFDPTVYQYKNFPSNTDLDVKGNPTPFTFILKRGSEEINGRLSYVDGLLKSFIDDDAFEGEANFTMTVIDECGFEYISDVIESKTYAVEAEFTFDPATGEAPLETSFELKNENPTGSEYQWFFYQDEIRIDGPVDTRDSLLTDIKIEKDEIYTYLHPGKYFVKLIVTNNDDSMDCSDIFKSGEIIVEGSIFEVPNVFTPNGDGANDEFKVKLYSVKSYSVKIFNRWGRMVYEFQESDVSPGLTDRKSTKGWNGKINGKLAAPGTYFYVIEAEGREEEGKHYTERGSLTLLHNR